MIRTKCVYSPIERRKDGLRILATRFRGRGMPVDRYDVWMPNLAPSEALLRDFLAAEVTWAEFSRRYRKELFEGGSADHRNVIIKTTGRSLPCACCSSSANAGSSRCFVTAQRINPTAIATC